MMRALHPIRSARGVVVLTLMAGLASSPGLAKESGNPSLTAIQAAYDAAKAEADGVHDDGLMIREADCQHDRANAYSCQITFTASSGQAGRLYFDVIGLDREPAGWKLVSGLCKRHD